MPADQSGDSAPFSSPALRERSARARAPGEGRPAPNCLLCPRLAEYRTANQAAYPDWFNAPVPSFGPLDARLAIVGLAPGLRGANRTGRPFTGDFAGVLLYETLIKFGLAAGQYGATPDDGLRLIDCRIINSVRCAPPNNLPTPSEIATCNQFLRQELAIMPRVRGFFALGGVAHGAVLRAKRLPLSSIRFAHGAINPLPDGTFLADSYHVSRYNTSTGRLTQAMFESAIAVLLTNLQS
jgi:uracil-DNA glycosylase